MEVIHENDYSFVSHTVEDVEELVQEIGKDKFDEIERLNNDWEEIIIFDSAEDLALYECDYGRYNIIWETISHDSNFPKIETYIDFKDLGEGILSFDGGMRIHRLSDDRVVYVA